MAGAELATRLRSLGLSQAQLRRWVESLTGASISHTTLVRPGRNPWRDALLATAEKHPAVLAEIKELGR